MNNVITITYRDLIIKIAVRVRLPLSVVADVIAALHESLDDLRGDTNAEIHIAEEDSK